MPHRSHGRTAGGRPAVLGIGIDVVSVPRITRLRERYSDDVLSLVFTPGELAAAAGAPRRGRHLAICFAAKEAVGKALACGLAGIGWTDIEATVRAGGLSVTLGGAAAERARRLAIEGITASWAQLGQDLALVLAVAY